MSKEKEILFSYLKKTLRKTDEEVEQLLYKKAEGSEELTLKENSIDALVTLDVERVASLKKAAQEEFDTKVERIKKDQHGKVKKETLEELEGALQDRFNIDAKDKKGMDLIEAIIAANTKTTIDLNDVKKHPAYIELEGKMTSDYVPKTEHEKLKEEYSGYKDALSAKEKRDLLRKNARTIIDNCKPKLPADAAKANQQIEIFMKTFVDTINADTSNPDNIIMLDSDGKRKEDQHGHAINFKSYIEQQTSSTFELLVSDPGGGAGNGNDGNTGKKEVKIPESLDDFNTIKSTLSGEPLLEFHNKYCAKFQLPPIQYNKKAD